MHPSKHLSLPTSFWKTAFHSSIKRLLHKSTMNMNKAESSFLLKLIFTGLQFYGHVLYNVIWKWRRDTLGSTSHLFATVLLNMSCSLSVSICFLIWVFNLTKTVTNCWSQLNVLNFLQFVYLILTFFFVIFFLIFSSKPSHAGCPHKGHGYLNKPATTFFRTSGVKGIYYQQNILLFF